MSSPATIAPGNAAPSGKIDPTNALHRDKRQKPSIEVAAVEETGKSVRRKRQQEVSCLCLRSQVSVASRPVRRPLPMLTHKRARIHA